MRLLGQNLVVTNDTLSYIYYKNILTKKKLPAIEHETTGQESKILNDNLHRFGMSNHYIK